MARNNSSYARRGSVKRRRLMIGKALTFLAVICGLVYGGWLGYAKLAWFNISDIEIEGAKKIDVSALKQQLQTGNMRIFNVDLEEIKRRLGQNPLVKDATVSLEMPSFNTLKVKINERSSYAQIRLVKETRYFTVDEEGIILEDAGIHSQPNMPCITGVDLQKVFLGEPCRDEGFLTGMDIISALKKNHWQEKVKEINVLDLQCPILILKGGINAKLGMDNYDEKIASLKTLWQNMNARIKEVDYVDLRFNNMAVVKFKNKNV